MVLASLAAIGPVESDDPLDSGGEKARLNLDADEAQAWLRTLTDLRLALGTRLGVEEGDEEHWQALPDDDPRRHIQDVYERLRWIRETPVRALSAGLD